MRPAIVTLTAAALLVAAVVTSLAFGAVNVPTGFVLDAFLGRADPGPMREIVLELRSPRTVTGLLVGASLGVAGALLQSALANPLASPDVIGVTGGAGFGAVLLLVAFPAQIALLPVGALGFGLLASAIVFSIAWSGPNRGSIGRLILAGIAVSAMFGAGITSILVAYPQRVQSAIFFLAGGLTSEGWTSLRVVWPYGVAGLLFALVMIRPLDRLALGDDVAASLGARPRAIRLGACVAAALLAATSAALAGLVSFIGLVIPHVVRLAGGTSANGFVVPTSALAGGALLLGGDTLARTVLAPKELPVGPLMVVLGVPLFLWLLRRAV